MKSLYESILSSTKSGRKNIQISEELLLSRGYIKKEFSDGDIRYYYREYSPGSSYFINQNFDGPWIIRAHCNKKSYTLEVHTLEELEKVEKVWDIPFDFTDKTRRLRNREFQKLVDTLKIKYRF
jgi:hypothetical protein